MGNLVLFVKAKAPFIMEFQNFLETSTIHGLGHIASKKNLARVFWITVVGVGFSVAGSLIYHSFNAWDENPVRTTIETRPIDEIIRFPKVTVCPPKNTYTNLNYDLGSMGYKMLDT